jgi:hypothetical protein
MSETARAIYLLIVVLAITGVFSMIAAYCLAALAFNRQDKRIDDQENKLTAQKLYALSQENRIQVLEEDSKKHRVPPNILAGIEDTTAIGNDVLWRLKDALEYAEFRIGQQAGILKQIRNGDKYDEDRPNGKWGV